MNTRNLAKLIVLLLLLMPMMAQADSSLINFQWHAETCRTNDTGQKCPDYGHIKDRDLFGVFLDANDRLALIVEEATDGSRRSFPLKIKNLCTIRCEVPILEAEFQEHGQIKDLTMAILKGSELSTTISDCERWIDEKAPENHFDAGEIDSECKRQDVIYWHIDTQEDTTLRSLAPPDDGHGTGSDGGQ